MVASMRIIRTSHVQPRLKAWIAFTVNTPFALPLLLLAHVTAWTIYSCLAQSAGTVHHDMTEAFTWGEHPALGYYKHPPFYAWVTGLWFQIFPRADWAFYLLSQVNAAAGLAGVWFLAGRVAGPKIQLASLLLLTLAPFHNIMAINYNANSGLLSLWPWTAFTFVKAMETGRARDGVLFGVFAAAAMLCKYYSVLLLLSCILASLANPRIKEIYRSWAPYAAVATGAALVAPHLWWLATHDWQTIEYAKHTGGFEPPFVLYKMVTTALASLCLLGLPFLVLAATFRSQVWPIHFAALRQGLRREGAPLLILAAGPFLLTLLVGMLGSVKISTNFLIPAFSLLPMAVLVLSRLLISPVHLTKIAGFAMIWPAAMIGVAPFIAFAQFSLGDGLTSEPRRELAEKVTSLWHETFGLPLKLVTGTNAYGSGMAFYSKDRPAEFIRLSYAQAPWVTPELLKTWGVAIACAGFDQDCKDKSAAIMTPRSKRIVLSSAHTFLNTTTTPREFEVFLIAPGDVPPVQPLALHRFK